MNLPFTPSAEKIMAAAQQIASRQSRQAETLDLLRALMQVEGEVSRLLRHLGFDLVHLRRQVEFRANRTQCEESSRCLEEVAEYATEEARQESRPCLREADLFIGLFKDTGGGAAGFFHSMGITLADVRQGIKEIEGRIPQEYSLDKLGNLLCEAGIKNLPARAALSFLRSIAKEVERQGLSAEALEEFAGYVVALDEGNTLFDDERRPFEDLIREGRDFKRVSDYFRRFKAEHDSA